MALPNPFQSTILPLQVLNTTPKTTQNDTILFHGYRSNFNINQQKLEYEHRMSQQIQQKFAETTHNRNYEQRNNTNEIIKNNSSSNNWCESCECNFKYPQQLQKHLDEHEKCWFDNCNFEGSSMLLKKHLEMQHQSGLFQQIIKVESNEDIEKWREERRKRYPTKTNIEARQMAQEERLKRGERIQDPKHRFGSHKNRKSAQQQSTTQSPNESLKNHDKKKNNDKKRRRTRNKNKSDWIDVKLISNEVTTTKSVESNIFNSVSAMKQCPVQLDEKIVPATNALAAIMGMYGSDSDNDGNDDDDATMSMNNVANEKQEKQVCNITENVTAACDLISTANESNKHHTIESIDNNSRKREAAIYDELPIKQFKIDKTAHNQSVEQEQEQEPGKEQEPENESDDNAPNEQPIQRQSNDLQESIEDASGPTKIKPLEHQRINSKTTLKNDKCQKKKSILDMTRKIRNQNTLLEKLLQKDIRHERNVLLQCVRYVVENQFFGIGQKTDERLKNA